MFKDAPTSLLRSWDKYMNCEKKKPKIIVGEILACDIYTGRPERYKNCKFK